MTAFNADAKAWLSAKAWFSYGTARLGRVGVAGVVLLAASVALIVAHHLRDDAARLQLRIVDARSRLQSAPVEAKPRRSAQTFLTQLPAAEQVPRFIEDVHRFAAQSGLQIERAEYRAPVLAGGLVLRSQVLLPVTGAYPGLVRWMAEVLSEHPSAAIDEMSLQRDSADSDQLHARVVFSHYSRSTP